MASIYPTANPIRSPATLIDNVYYSDSSLVQSAARCSNKDSYRFPFNSNSLGSTVTLVVQKNIMATHVLVVMEMPVDITNTVQGLYMDMGWGFKAIQRIQLQYGSSEVLEIDGHDNFMRAINEAENDRKKSAIIENAGAFSQLPLGSTLASQAVGASFAQNGSNYVWRAVVPIVLPHSSVNSIRQMPYDVSLLSQSINIRLTMAPASDLWQWAGYRTGAAKPALSPIMSSFSFAEWVVGQTVLIDEATYSKKDLVSGMGPNSNYELSYFWYYPQHNENLFNVNPILDGLTAITTSPMQSVTLTGFRNGGLQGFVFWVERIGPFNSLRNQAQAQVLPASQGLDTMPMTNITLFYAGQQIYRSESKQLSQAIDYMVNTTDSTYDYAPAFSTGNANGAAVAGTPVRQDFVRVQLAQWSEVMHGGSALQAGALLSNDNLQLNFQIEDCFSLDSTGVPAGTQIQYRLNVQQLYQSALVVSRGSGSFRFVNPLGQPQIAFNNL